ncbi:hypothetical protein Tco_1407450 [Tanacetum coccineum]
MAFDSLVRSCALEKDRGGEKRKSRGGAEKGLSKRKRCKQFSVEARSDAHKKLQRAYMFLEDGHICSNKFDEKTQRSHMFLEWRS